MTKTSKRLVVSAASLLIAASMIQAATASDRTTKRHVATTASQQVRNANASASPYYVDRDETRFRDEALAPPAGR
jgi:hypothetical protein